MVDFKFEVESTDTVRTLGRWTRSFNSVGERLTLSGLVIPWSIKNLRRFQLAEMPLISEILLPARAHHFDAWSLAPFRLFPGDV